MPWCPAPWLWPRKQAPSNLGVSSTAATLEGPRPADRAAHMVGSRLVAAWRIPGSPAAASTHYEVAHMQSKGSVYEGKTLDDAVRKGLEALGLSRAEVMITVMEEGSGG